MRKQDSYKNIVRIKTWINQQWSMNFNGDLERKKQSVYNWFVLFFNQSPKNNPILLILLPERPLYLTANKHYLILFSFNYYIFFI